ncbi:MAG: DUF4290 domain-containing protein [Marinilabiliaceae bacterium]|jgi:hypothetical protein|nr:DUF4290 domain-containing protein [Marinilabiliaceae bacterium]
MNHDYNTQRKRMELPEYGRNVQKMIDHIKTIEDRDERNKAARTIIQIMGNLNPNLRDGGDIKHKLWDHLTIISGFELDIDSPYPPPKKEKLLEKPDRVDYKNGEVKYLHYGRVVEMMVEEAVKMPEGKEREYLAVLIANQMKKSAAAWNRGNVSDDVIFKDILDLSGNKLLIPAGTKLLEVKELIGPRKKKPVKHTGKQPKKKHHSRY